MSVEPVVEQTKNINIEGCIGACRLTMLSLETETTPTFGQAAKQTEKVYYARTLAWQQPRNRTRANRTTTIRLHRFCTRDENKRS